MGAPLVIVQRVLARAKASSDIVLAVVMASIVGAMIVPLPGWLLDVGIALNLAAALALLVAALYAKDALKVAAFPTLLLITTLFRLAMNVSSTRLALSEGHAGDIIQAFGEFVVRGDYVVGAVIFAILTLVQFLVVAKGAERVAEVSARFTLDAMPGKQMSIDADLRAGAINQAQARARRRELERESQLFGSMDGAMKFVKGDVIAGLVIVLINLVGGIAIGVLQNGMTAAEAASTYALISIGDGLVSQIPSLCIAVAAGLVVTRVASESDEASLGGDIGAQFFGQWKALFVVAGLCFLLACMPGMPHFTFIAIAACAAAAGFGLKQLASKPDAGAAAAGKAPGAQEAPKPVEPEIGVAPIVVDLAADLTALTTQNDGKFVSHDLTVVRDRLFHELGVRVPGIRVRTGAPLPAGSYLVQIDEVPSVRGQVALGQLIAMVPVNELSFLNIAAEPVLDPITGAKASRVGEESRAQLEAAEIRVSGPAQIICSHVYLALKRRAPHFLGVQEVQAALEQLEKRYPALVKEALAKVPIALLTDVLKRLLQEEVSIRNLKAILEALVSPSTEGDAAALAEKSRQALARQLSHRYAPSGPLFAFLVDPAIEEAVRAGGPAMALEPQQAGAIIEGVRRVATQGRAVLLSSPDIRRNLRRLIEGAFPDVAVLTFHELDPELQVRPVGRLVPVQR
ncbi:MAG: type III secretion system export apparatus subunit SctV [Myxococcaceae bacterium]|nr:type III secretion system export apparatus subunit SctV [Myxococcaceae bacterium]